MAVKIPLRQKEAPIEIPLQPLLNQADDNGRYAETINYSQPPEPPFESDDAEWADALLRRAGRRK